MQAKCWASCCKCFQPQELLVELCNVFTGTATTWLGECLIGVDSEPSFSIVLCGAVPADNNWICDIVETVPALRSAIEEVLERLWLEETSLLPRYLSIHDLYNLESVALLLCHATTRPSFKFSDLIDQLPNGMPSLYRRDWS